MKVLFDTSAIVAALWAEHPSHSEAISWVAKVRQGEIVGMIAQHTLLESYAVITGLPSRPKVAPALAKEALLDIVKGFEIQEAGASDYRSVLDRAEAHNFSGGIVYDLLIWQAAETSGCDLLITGNARDFRRFESSTGLKIQSL